MSDTPPHNPATDTPVAARLDAVRRTLATLEAEVVAAIATDKTRGRGDRLRTLHEIRRMRTPDTYPYFSQASQDMIVDRLLGQKRGGTFVDIGGYDGLSGSNTLFFEKWRGWTGVLVEPVPAMLDRARSVRDCPCLGLAVAATDGAAEFLEISKGYTQMSGLTDSYDAGLLAQVRADPRHQENTIRVETRTIGRILIEAGIEAPDFISLDIEGGEVAALEAFDFERHRARIWAIENNTGTGRIAEIMRGSGHELMELCGADEIWRKKDL